MGSGVSATVGRVPESVGGVELRAGEQCAGAAPGCGPVKDILRFGDDKVDAGGLAATGQRLLIRTYCEIAKGAKIAMMATQHNTA